MTREEAINKLRKELPYSDDNINPTLLVMSLEKLGLIKFDVECPLDIIGNYLCNHVVDYPMSKADDIINVLKSKGYDIVKKG